MISKRSTVAEVVVAAVRSDIGWILAADPLVRLRARIGADDTAVHQMRVGCRRLRSDLRTFDPLVAPDWAFQLRAELAWFAGKLGAARDVEVLRARLVRTARADPLVPLDVGGFDAVLAVREEKALAALDLAMRSARYGALTDLLDAAAATPRVTAAAMIAPARAALPRLVARPWRRLRTAARRLDPLAPDEVWHAVRIRTKRARYAVEAVAPAVGKPAARLGRALAAVQDVLGEHQDAALAAEAWLALARGRAVTAGRLAERERAAVLAARAAFPAAWRAATRRAVSEWISD